MSTTYKRIKNMTRQGLEVVVKKPGGGYDHLWVPSKSTVVINGDLITSLVRVAEQRKLLKISNA